MIQQNLYKTVLLDPHYKNGANELFIVAGYASATFANRHLKALVGKANVNLVIGMPTKKNDHQAFLSLLKRYPGNFTGYYYDGTPNVHCKLYSWFEGKTEKCGFSGSANYSQNGFFETSQINQMVEDNANDIKAYYFELVKKSIPIQNANVPAITSGQGPPKVGSIKPGAIEWIIPDKMVRISFLAKDGTFSGKANIKKYGFDRGGLNWGHRSVGGPVRNLNEAYLSIRQDARKVGFLPPKEFTFTMLTDDQESLDCAVQQSDRKGISTTYDNSILGSYIRQRLGVAGGILIKVSDLEAYGRTDFTLMKLDDETFLFDMSV